jgi:hypothetical protein
MNDAAQLVSKVLILDRDEASLACLRTFCEAHDLVGLKVHSDSVMAVLTSNVDLGGIFLAEDYVATEASGVALAHEIHRVRPELPIFLRRSSQTELSAGDLHVLKASFHVDDTSALAAAVAESIFSLVYPNALVRGIAEITMHALAAQFPQCSFTHEAPYIVHDRIIHGEMFTLIPLESSWCRGYMMLQVEERSMRDLLELGQGEDEASTEVGFRTLNNMLGEATNLIWGAFKNRFIDYGDIGGHLTQIPIVINHQHRYISFGSQEPQLCFRYALTDPLRPDTPPTVLYQRFIFNLSWTPDDFKENQASVEDLFDSGELELF